MIISFLTGCVQQETSALVRVLTQGLKIVTVVMVAILSVSGSIWFFDYWQDRELAGERGRPVIVQVAPEDDAGAVSDKLTDAKLVQFGWYFEGRMRFSDVDLRPGTYTLRTGMGVMDIIDTITVQTTFGAEEAAEEVVQEPFQVTFIEGQRAEEFGAQLEAAGMPNGQAEFMAALNNPDIRAGYDFLDGVPDDASINGFLFPDTYNIPADSEAADVVYYMLDTFDDRVTPEDRAGFEAQGLSLYEAITLASIVEREAAVREERPTIAAVYLNRIEQGTVLNADPTLQYAAGTPEEWWPTLGDAELAMEGPYNTYINPGLPPSPISNPGVASIQAVANPADVDFQFFVAKQDGTGEHVFATTYEEHQQNVCTYNPPACEGAGLPPSLAAAPVTGGRWMLV
jgi:UPF0755 protein